MAFCKACGQDIGTANFCPKCGASQAVPAASPIPPATASSGGLQENVAGLLCYVLGWVTGIIFLLIDKRPWVKFHAAQSIVVFGGLTLIIILLGMMHGVTGFIGWSFFGLLVIVVRLVGFVLWIVLMIKAFQHQTWRVPIAADIADGFVK